MSSRILRRIACIAIALGIGVLWRPSSANANMQLELASGGQSMTFADTGNTGVVTTGDVSVGAFTVNVATGFSTALSPGSVALLDLNSFNATSSAGGTMTITLENSYSGPIQGLGAFGTVGGTITNGTVTASAFVDPPNSVLQDLSATASSSSGGQAAIVSGAGSTTFANTGTFSLYETFVITLNAGGSFSADASNMVVPEPSSLAVAVIGALGMIGFGLRRRKTLGA
jgi:hypothetical protein